MIPYTMEAYDLLHSGQLCMEKLEEDGIRIDVDYLDGAMRRTRRKITAMKVGMQESKVADIWRKTYGTRMNWSSREQLGTILFKKMGYTPTGETPGGRPKVDINSLSHVDDPFVVGYLKLEKLEKAYGTYLRGIRREVVDGYVHCFFNLHLVSSYRSSSNSPNLQNQPKRDEATRKLIRRCFVARPGRMLVELDFSGNEVKCAAAYHKDPRMLEYLNNPKSDMHRDLACMLFKLPEKEVSKEIRFYAKNGFTFAEFYGSAWFLCAPVLWDVASKLTTVGGKNLLQHLNERGFYKLGNSNPKDGPAAGSFEENVHRVEKDMWERRFRIYAQWKKDWYEDYQKRGWFKTLTGFICQGYLRRNQVINLPVQGSAFHFLLKALIQIVMKELPRRRMKSRVVAQVHDSLLVDVVPEEYDELVGLCHHVMTEMLPRFYSWINTPMAIEVEAGPVDGSWADIEKQDITATIADFDDGEE